MPAVDMEKRAAWLKANTARIEEKRRERYAKVSASPKKRKARAKKRNDYFKSHDKPYHQARTKRYRDKRKAEIIAAYGGKCTCPGCTVAEPEFLTVEHLGKDGKAHRASGVSVYADIRRRGFPPDYTIYCFNCNIAKSLFGSCPHTRAKSELVLVDMERT